MAVSTTVGTGRELYNLTFWFFQGTLKLNMNITYFYVLLFLFTFTFGNRTMQTVSIIALLKRLGNLL